LPSRAAAESGAASVVEVRPELVAHGHGDPASREVVTLDATSAAWPLGHKPFAVGVVLFDLGAPVVVQIVKPDIGVACSSFGHVQPQHVNLLDVRD